jgi:hypothetical protein
MLNNDPDELDKFKREINLAAYIEDQGFTYYPKKSSRNNPAYIGASEYEVFIVGKKHDTGHHVFINPFNDADSGSIIDFVLNRKKCTLGEVRQHLRSYMGYVKDRPLLEHQQYRPDKVDTARIQKMFAYATALKDREFLHARGFSDKTLDSAAFKNRIGNQKFTNSNGVKYTNTVFPIYNLEGLAGLERRNFKLKTAAADSDKTNGMWFSNYNKENPSVHRKFFISETPIDCISRHQMKNVPADDLSHLFFSSNGRINKGHFDFVQHYINQCSPDVISLGNDNDAAGSRFNLNWAGNLKDVQPTKEQECVTFFMDSITEKNDTSKVYLDVQFKGDGGNCPALKSDIIKEIMAVDSRIGEPAEFKDKNNTSTRFIFLNRQVEIDKLYAIVTKYRPVLIVEVDRPRSKDFNEDLQKSIEIKKNSNDLTM